MAGVDAASDVEGGQQPVQKARKHRSGWHTLARPLPAIDTTGVGWYAIIVSLLSTVALIILADEANKLTIRMNDSSHIEGLKLMAQQDPSTICTNASLAERTYGTSGVAMLSCDEGLREWPLTMRWSGGDNGDLLGNLLSVVAGLESCRAIKGYYTPHDLLHALDTEQARSQINGDNPTNTELYRKVNAPNMAHISTIIGVLQLDQRDHAWSQVLACHSHNTTSPSQGALWLVGNEYAALLRSGRSAGYEIESRLYAPLESNTVCFTNRSSSAWKGRDLVMRVVGKNWPTSSMWLHLRQDASTATCVFDFLRKNYPGAKETLANCSNSFVLSQALLPYSCSKGVDDTAMQKAEEFMLIAKRTNTVSFLFMRDLSSDDVYAIYTGALGSVFAAVTCVAATAVLVVVVLVWRVLFGTGTDACRCGIVQ